MTWSSSEQLVRRILGAGRPRVSALAMAVDVCADLMFRQGVAMDDIQVTKMIYPAVAREMHASCAATARQIQRLANLSYDMLVTRHWVKQYIGISSFQLRSPSDMLFYLAFYLHFGKSFYEMIDQHPELLF